MPRCTLRRWSPLGLLPLSLVAALLLAAPARAGQPAPGGGEAGEAAAPPAGDPQRLFVAPIQGSKGLEEPARLLGEALKSALLGTGRFTISSDGELDRQIDEAVRACASDKIEDACGVRLGGGKGARKLVSGRLEQEPGGPAAKPARGGPAASLPARRCYLTLALVDLETRQEERRAFEATDCQTAELLATVPRLAASLAGLAPATPGATTPPGEAAPPAAPPTGDAITLKTYVLCRRPVPGGPARELPECVDQILHARDQVKVAIEADRSVYVYVLNHNETGQFQVLLPEVGAVNLIPPGGLVMLPPGDAWLELDEQAGVTERLQVVASVSPLLELERLRGVEIPAGGTPAQQQAATQARGMLEGFTARGLSLKKGSAGAAPAKVAIGDELVSALPLIAKRPGVAVIEFPLQHR